MHFTLPFWFIDFSLNLHFLFGVPPLGYTYKESYKIKIGAINGNIVASQLLSLFSFLDHFIDYFLNKENKVHPLIKAKDDNIVALSVNIGYGSLYLWGGHTVTHLSLPAGVKVFLNTYVTHLGNMKVNVFLPKLSIKTYIPAEGTAIDYYTHIDDWCEVGNASAALAISVFIKDDTWIEDGIRQKEYLREQDSGSHRLHFLWEHRKKETKYAVRDLNGLRDLDPQSQTMIEETCKPSTGMKKSKKDKRSKGSCQQKSTSNENETEEYDGEDDESDSGDDSDTDNDNDDDDDDDSDEKDEMVKDNRNFVNNVQSHVSYPSCPGTRMGMETGSRCAVSSNSFRSEYFGVDSSTAFAASPFTKHVSLVEGRPVPFNVAPREPLLRFIPQGSKLNTNDDDEEPDDYMESGFETSFSYILDKKGKKQSRKRVRVHKNDSGITGNRYEQTHKKDTTTITIVVDGLKEIQAFMSPHILTLVEDVLMSLILKNTSTRDILDKLQSRAMSQIKTTPNSKHSKVQLIASLNGVHLNSIHIQPPLSTSKVLASQTNIGPVKVHFSICNRAFENPDRMEGESSESLAEQARALTLDCTELCSLCLSVSLDHINFKMAQKMPQDITERINNGWGSTEELIDRLLSEDQREKFMNFSLGRTTCIACNNTANTKEKDLDMGFTFVTSNPTLLASNDIGVLLSFMLPILVGKIQKIVGIAKHISEVNEKEIKGLVIEILDNEMKKL